MNLTFSRPPPDPSNRRRSSGPKARNFSGSSAKGPFANPDDQIYEEPEEQPSQALLISNESSPMPAPLQPKLRSPQAVRRTRDPPARANTAPLLSAAYLTNPLPPTPPGSGSDGDVRHAPDGYSTKDGVEVRGDEIRQATSMRRRERSPKLPSPSFVSAAPGRPIVSFDRDWKAKDAARPQDASLGRDRYLTKELPPNPAPYQPRGKGGVRGHTSSAVPVPSMRVPTTGASPGASRPAPAVPTVNVPTINVPTINVPTINLPIAGRIVSAAGQRFHPECFICFHCGEGLECVAFYPEPESSREDRVDRIRKRACGEHVEEVEGRGELEDGDEALRFYCHLDFHEFFSPRCRSCKTPIEGEVVVACGGEWHVGHFFCAECGDPFDPSTPFVEKDGYAWCVNCHTNRYSTKCKKCRKPVTDQVVTALGAEWHAECFCCVECHGDFDDGRYFLRGDEEEPVCVRCEERRLKA
ncbi:MAG: hypothetical protein M1832_004888 [Thelocarpon impressellum]|nr:MAG: hypothetical protein M1832_004888 [Thelocarpon impressellum]